MKKISVLLLSVAMSAMAIAEETPTETSMDIIAKKQSIPCSTELRHLASESLKLNPHRMLPYSDETYDDHLFNALAVTSYRDRDSHVTFHGVQTSSGQCHTSVTESFILETNCADARHEAFSKWDFEGKLNDRTSVLANKEEPAKQAFLTDQFSSLCLVTTRQVVVNN